MGASISEDNVHLSASRVNDKTKTGIFLALQIFSSSKKKVFEIIY